MASRSATIVGYHGRKNFGDDIFLRVAATWLHRHFAIERIFVAGKKGSIPARLAAAEVVAFEKRRYLITRLLWIDILRYALQSRVLLFAAGSIFSIQPFVLVWTILKLLRTVQAQDFRIAAMGVSVGPYRDEISRVVCPRVFELMDFALLRDRASAALLEAGGRSVRSSLSYDLALQWEPAWQPRATPTPDTGETLGVCLHPGAWGTDFEKKSDAALDAIVGAIVDMSLKYPSLRIELFAACDDDVDGDGPVLDRLRERLAALKLSVQHIRYDGLNPDAFAHRLQSCVALVTSRMHVGIIGMMGAVPVLQVNYARKVGDFFEHCGLDKEHLFSGIEIEDRDRIRRFLFDAIAGNLQAVAARRRDSLAVLRQRVDEALDSLARRLLEREALPKTRSRVDVP